MARTGSKTHSKTPRLSKSRFVAGLQCPKQLWWKVHEPDAPELQAGPELQAVFDRGHRVGELARERVPGGVLIDLPHHAIAERVAATARALADGASVVYEASFLEDGVFVSVDILERKGRGLRLIEVKSTLDVKEPHIPDVAIQLHVVRRAGLEVRRAELMHLNRECRHPELSNLFVRENVTSLVEAALPSLRPRIAPMLQMLAGPCPKVEPGAHCDEPYECPFQSRCLEPLPEHHVSTLYLMRSARWQALVDKGQETLFDLPDGYTATGATLRQIESVKRGQLIVEPGLGRALEDAIGKGPVGYLDFETVAPPIPAWPGCSPYQPVAVQFSYHGPRPRSAGEQRGEGRRGEKLVHTAWLAEGPCDGDPRAALAEALVRACAEAETVLAYNASFEKLRIKDLALAVPRLKKQLLNLSERLVDLLPIVRNHIYHPDFGGSFSIKSVLPALCPGLGYDDLEIADGQSAANLLEAWLFSTALTPAERVRLRAALLDYCERDTLAMVRLHEGLVELAKKPARLRPMSTRS